MWGQGKQPKEINVLGQPGLSHPQSARAQEGRLHGEGTKMDSEEQKQWEAQCAWQNQLLAFQGLGEKERGEQEIKYRKVNGVSWGQMWKASRGTLGSAQHVEQTIGTEPGWGALSVETARLETGLGPFTL